MKRRGALLALLCVGLVGSQAPAATPSRKVAPTDAASPAPSASDAGVLRLQAVVRQQLARRKPRATLSFDDAVLAPATNRLQWGPATLRSPAAKGRSWRAGIDRRTRWYYVLESGGRSPDRWFGPLEERSEGRFETVGGDLPR